MGLLDICDAYRQYCEIRSGNLCFQAEEGYRKSEESLAAKCSREALAQLSAIVESNLQADTRTSIFDEIRKLMSLLPLMADMSEFSRFYEFVFFVCRENGQKSIPVHKAITAWKLVLVGRFRMLNQWCDFVEQNQRHNISEDTWKQVLTFSCVQENLNSYDSAGAWPVLIDEFVEHIFSVAGPNDLQSQTCICDDSLTGLNCLPRLKRKGTEDMERDDNSTSFGFVKRHRLGLENDFVGMTRNSRGTSSSKSHCAIEDSLSQGFAGLFPARSCLKLNRESYKPSAADEVL